MNILKKMVSELKFRIPEEILKLVFKDKEHWRSIDNNVSIEQIILNTVVRPRLLVDCDIVGGTEVIVPLEGLSPLFIDVNTIVYQIPSHLINNRTIISVMSVSYLPYTSSYNASGLGSTPVNMQSMNDINAVANRVGMSHSSMPVISNANVELIDDNTVLIRDQYKITGAYQLRCRVANEKNLNNIKARSSLIFAKALEYCVKSYIYNKMIIKLDMGYLSGGQEMPSIRNYVESLSDAEENYQTYIKEVVSKVSVMNDEIAYTRFIKSQLSPGV